jgi:hypothetical protein
MRRFFVTDFSAALRGKIPVAGASVLLLLTACLPDQGLPDPPAARDVASLYAYEGGLDVEMSGNVARISVGIDREQYLRGGGLWAKASPYIFLFSSSTREAFQTHEGLGGVRVIVRYEDGTLVAQALLERATLNSVGWDRALNIAGLARTEGTESPGYMRDLVNWGEDHTDFQYNPENVPGAS